MVSSKSNKKIIEYYDSTFFEYCLVLGLKSHLGMHHGYYDKDHKTYKEANLNLNRVLARKADIKKGEKVLDAGCGIGGSAIWLAKNIGCQVTGITLSKKQVNEAQKNAQKHGVSDLTKFLVRDFRETKFKDKSFDVVWSIESVCHAEDKLDFIKEVLRVLKPKGRLIVSDGFLKKRNMTGDEKALMKKWLSGWVVKSLDYVNDFKRKMKEAGFKNIKSWQATKKVMPFSKWVARRASVLTPVAQVLRLLGIFTKVQTDNGIAAIKQYEALKKGLWEYAIVYGERG